MDVVWTNEMDSIFLQLKNEPQLTMMPTFPDDRHQQPKPKLT